MPGTKLLEISFHVWRDQARRGHSGFAHSPYTKVMVRATVQQSVNSLEMIQNTDHLQLCWRMQFAWSPLLLQYVIYTPDFGMCSVFIVFFVVYHLNLIIISYVPIYISIYKWILVLILKVCIWVIRCTGIESTYPTLPIYWQWSRKTRKSFRWHMHI